MTRDFSTLSFSCVLMFSSINAAAVALAVVDVIPHKRTHSHILTRMLALTLNSSAHTPNSKQGGRQTERVIRAHTK